MTIQRRAAAPRTHDDGDDKNMAFSSAELDPTLQRQHEDKQDVHMKRQREKAAEKRRVHDGAHATATAAAATATTGSTFSIYSVIRLLLGCLVTSCALSYFVTGDSLFWGHRPWYTRIDNVRAWLVRYLIFVLFLFFSFLLLLLETFEFFHRAFM